MSRKEIRFWLIFVLLNTLLFLPRYIIEIDTSTFFPRLLPPKGEAFQAGRIIFRRFNYDLFRVSIDLLLITVIYFLLGKKINSRIASWIAGAYYLIILLFLVYYNAFEKIYIVKPLLLSDLYMLKLAFFNVGSSNLFLLIILPLGLFTLYLLSRYAFLHYFRVIENLKPGRISWSVFGALLFFYFLNIVSHGMTITPSHVYQLTGALITDNFMLSAKAAESTLPDKLKSGEAKYAYGKYHLAETPDIYMIMVESYGNIVNRDSNLTKPYTQLISRCISDLGKAGWSVTSSLSTSPVSGGKSWLAFTSVLYGVRVSDQGTYLNMLKSYKSVEYTHLARYLHHQDYGIYWLNALPNRKEITIPWDLYTDFYGVDHWILDSDMNYTGERYGFGPSPPDQYSLNYARDYMGRDKNPHFLFFITQNSHSPFAAPLTVEKDWRALNNNPMSNIPKPEFLKKPVLEDYLNAIAYELKFITDFIINDTSGKSVYIVLGDHQPPVLTGHSSGFETPLHIISKDEKFVKGFEEYGFKNGFLTSDCSKPLKHEALYSMLMRELNRNYGSNPAELPDYLPDGITGSRK